MRYTKNSFLIVITLLSCTVARCTDRNIVMPESELDVEWTSLNSGTENTLTDIYFLNDKVGWILGGSLALKTEDGGESWQTTNIGDGIDYSEVLFINSNEGWMYGKNESNSPVIFKSTDNGENWSQISEIISPEGIFLGPGQMYSKMNFVNSQTGWITVPYLYMLSAQKLGWIRRIMKTTDGGLNWTEQLRDTLDTELDNEAGFHGMHMMSENVGWVLGCQTLYKTENGGETWILQKKNIKSTDDDRHWWDICFLDQQKGYFTTRNEGLFQTTDGGNSWNQVLPETIGEMYAINFLNDQLGVIAGEKVYLTKDGGSNWQEIYHNAEHKFHDVCFIDENTIFAVGVNGIIVKLSVNNPGTSVAQNGHPSTIPGVIQLMQNYPNPFNPETIIAYCLPTLTHVKISVIDAIGRHIKTLVNSTQSQGQHQTVWDSRDAFGKTVSSGVYFYRIVAGEHQEVRKMTLMR